MRPGQPHSKSTHATTGFVGSIEGNKHEKLNHFETKMKNQGTVKTIKVRKRFPLIF
jgi:hypothetical protein